MSTIPAVYATPGDIGPLYELTPDQIRLRSRHEIAATLVDYGTKLLQSEEDDFRRYMLITRIRDLCNEVLSPSSGGLFEALVGMSYIAPHVLTKLLSENAQALHVFMARDAASDYIVADLMNKLDIRSNDAVLVYISRNTLGEAYRKVVCLGESTTITEQLHEKMFALYDSDPQFEQSINTLITTLDECGALNRHHVRYLDSWAEGTMFSMISFAHKIARRQGKISLPAQDITYRVMNNKARLRVVKTDFDYQNVVESLHDPYSVPLDFYESFQRANRQHPYVTPLTATYKPSQHDISLWYVQEQLEAPKITNIEDFSELMRVRIYKNHNHFGSLNLGHPFEWDYTTGSIIDASPDKKVGSLLRQLLLVNSILGYRDGYKSLDDTLRTSTVKLPPRADPALIGTDYSSDEGIALDTIIRENAEHFATSGSVAAKNLCLNLRCMMRLLDKSAVLSASNRKNYDFQYFINDIKKYSPSDFENRLSHIKTAMGVQTTIELFTQSPVDFLGALRNSLREYEMISRDIACIVLDIDGTVTPVYNAIHMFAAILRSGKCLGFITGRPIRACQNICDNLFAVMSPAELEQYKNKLVFHAANGARTVYGDGRIRQSTFSNSDQEIILKFAAANEFTVISRKEYRFLLRPNSSNGNQNQLRWTANQLAGALGASTGVYIAKWYEDTSDQIDLPYNVIDVCAGTRQAALDAITSWMQGIDKHATQSNILYLADEPELADSGMFENGISVHGFGLRKTRKIVERILHG